MKKEEAFGVGLHKLPSLNLFLKVQRAHSERLKIRGDASVRWCDNNDNTKVMEFYIIMYTCM